MNKKIKEITENLKDKRSKKVIFVAHCILNENTRYLGGAFKESSVDHIVLELLEKGIGIVQIECPEQEAWGGVLKKSLLSILDSKNTLIYRLRKVAIPIFIWNTKRKYRKIAKKVVLNIEDYLNSGFEVVGIIGIGGSPTCGVNTSLDIKKFVDLAANTKINEINTEKMNFMVKECLIDGRGLFIEELDRELSKNNLNIKIFEHNLISEMNGKEEQLNLE